MKRDRKQRFSIRKFSMGTGSILLGFTIFTAITTHEAKASELISNKSTEKDDVDHTSTNSQEDLSETTAPQKKDEEIQKDDVDYASTNSQEDLSETTAPQKKDEETQKDDVKHTSITPQEDLSETKYSKLKENQTIKAAQAVPPNPYHGVSDKYYGGFLGLFGRPGLTTDINPERKTIINGEKAKAHADFRIPGLINLDNTSYQWYMYRNNQWTSISGQTKKDLDIL